MANSNSTALATLPQPTATEAAAAAAGVDVDRLNWGEIDTASFQSVLQWSLRQAGDGTRATDEELRQCADPERQEWLRAAFDALTVDMVKVLKENIAKLSLKDDAEDVVEQKLDAMQALEDLVEDLDNARDLHLLGGFAPVLQCLRSKHSSIRRRALDLVGTVVQNNPLCQRFALELNAMSVVLPLLGDEDEQARLKAVRACSCLVREYDPLLKQFLEGNGIARLAVFLTSSNEQLLSRTIFFFGYLSRLGSVTTAELQRNNVVEKIFKSLQATNSNDIWEHGLATLLNLALNQPSFAVTSLRSLPLTAALSERSKHRQSAPADEQDRFREEIDSEQELRKLLL